MNKEKISENDKKSNCNSAQTEPGDFEGGSQCPIIIKISRFRTERTISDTGDFEGWSITKIQGDCYLNV